MTTTYGRHDPGEVERKERNGFGRQRQQRLTAARLVDGRRDVRFSDQARPRVVRADVAVLIARRRVQRVAGLGR